MTQTIQDKAKDMAADLGNKAKEKAAQMTMSFLDTLKNMNLCKMTVQDLKQAKAETDDIMRPAHRPTFIMVEGQRYPIPPDLDDKHSHLIFDAHGQRITGRLLVSDVIGGDGFSSPSPAYPILAAKLRIAKLAVVPCFAMAAFLSAYVGVAAAVGYGVYAHLVGNGIKLKDALPKRGGGIFSYVFKLMKGGMGLIIPLAILYMTSGASWWLKLAVWPWIPLVTALMAPSAREQNISRDVALQEQDFHFRRASFASNGYIDEIKAASKALYAQAFQAFRDKSPLIDLGMTATGIMSKIGSFFSPDAGRKLVLSLEDFFPGFFVWGEPGSGKTAGFLRRLYDQLKYAGCGLLLLDNKGDMQLEHILDKGFKLITPEDITYKGIFIKAVDFNPIEGMNGETVGDFLPQAFAGEQAKSDEWMKAARDVSTMCAILLEFACKLQPNNFKWTLHNVFKSISDAKYMWEVINCITADRETRWAKSGGGNKYINENPHVKLALDWVKGYFADLSDRTKSSVMMSIRGWANDLEGNREMARWMNCDHGVKIEDVLLRNKDGSYNHYGVYCPKAIYKEAGTAIEKLCRWRLYRAIKARGSEWRNIPADEQGRTHTPVVMIWDEMALGIGNGQQEADIMPIARSLGLAIVGAAQTINQFFERIGVDRTRALMLNFPHLASYRCDKETMEYMKERLGYIAKILPCGPNDIPVGIDYYGSINAIAQSKTPAISAMYDQELLENATVSSSTSDKGGSDPARLIMNLMPFMPARQNVSTSLSFKHVAPEYEGMRFVNGGKIKLENKPLWDVEEMGRLLETPYYCVVQIKRAGVNRRDICVTTPIHISDKFATKDAKTELKKAA